MVESKEPSAEQPETVLDLVIVGAGVAGLAAALRASELGLRALLVDRDDVLALVRVWDEHRQRVHATFNARDRALPFPRGGARVSTLAFEDLEDAEALCERWLDSLQQSGLPWQAGIDLEGVDELEGGQLRVHGRRVDRADWQVRTRSVVLALGNGLRRGVELPGETGELSREVGSGERFLREPACVLGSGSLAAESVLQILEVKARAGDQSPVYWSYRCAGRPAIDELLEGPLQSAIDQGRVLELPASRPVAVLDHPQHRGVAVEVQTEVEPTGVRGLRVLEFDVQRVVLCAGHRPAEALLESLGLEEIEVVDQDIEAPAVTPWYESARRNVFLVGDMLAPAYVQTEDFDPDSGGLAVREHRACFKFAMRDGVLAAEAVHARFREGLDDHSLRARMLALEESWGPGSEDEVAGVPCKTPTTRPPTPRSSVVARFTLLGEGGRPDQEISLASGPTAIEQASGRRVSGPAAQGWSGVWVDEGGCTVSDADGAGETLVQIAIERTLEKGSRFLAGSQSFELQSAQGIPMLAVLTAEGSVHRVLPIPPDGRDYGRLETSSVSGIDAQDRTLSRRHFRVQGDGQTFILRDWGSVNGTYAWVGPRGMKLVRGDLLWVGEHRLRFEGLEDPDRPAAAGPADSPAVAGAADSPATPSAGGPGPEGARQGAELAAAELEVLPAGVHLALDPERSVLEHLIEAGLATKSAEAADQHGSVLWSCGGTPSCYFCLVRVLEGGEHLGEPGKQERRGLKLKVASLAEEGFELSADQCRLACLSRARGSVRIQTLGNTDV